MGKNSKIYLPWEKDKEKIHSPNGVKELRASLKDALIRKYTGMAETMFQWTFPDACFSDFKAMTRDDEPERMLMRSGQCCCYRLPGTDQLDILPIVTDSTLNLHGNPTGWHPIPVGWSIDKPSNSVFDSVMSLKLDSDSSVLIKDSIYNRSDYDLICSAVNALVDNYLTLNQLSLLAKSPYIFNISQNNYLDAKNFFLALSEDKPVIIRRADGEPMESTIESTGSSIDTALFDVIRQWENLLLEQLGIPGSQKTQKRAQQTVDEINIGEDMTSLRRKEKYRMRKLAIDRINEKFGTHVTILSIIDSLDDDKALAGDLDKGDDDE